MTAWERLSGVDGRRGRMGPGVGVVATVVLLHWAMLGGWRTRAEPAVPRALQVRTVMAVPEPVAAVAPESPPAAVVLERPRSPQSRRALASARTPAVDRVSPRALAQRPSTAAAALTDAGSSVSDPAVPAAGPNPAVLPAVPVARPDPTFAVPEDAEPPPVYRTRLPLPATFHFDVRRGAASGVAELRWQRTADGYSLHAEVRVGGFPVLTQSSRGGVDAAGLAPVRFVDQRATRASAAVNFRRDSGRISFSRKAADAVLVAGAQDRLSWIVQLAAILAADPGLRQDGAEVRMSIAGAGGEVSVWRFRCEGAESTGPGDALQPAWHCVRAAAGPYDTRAEAWLGRVGDDVLPLRAAWRSGPTDDGFDLRLQRADALPE